MIPVAVTEAVAACLEAEVLGESALHELREAYPGLHFTYCMDDDIAAGRPVVQRSGFKLYLVDGRGHCLRLTDDHDVATGMVVAEVTEED